jgi:cob(I)alamin adenosyltransferase
VESPAAEPRKIKVYTRTGDKGTASLYNGERRSKDDLVFEALGAVDELNAHVGLAREHVIALKVGIEEQLEDIQSRLLDVGSAVATPVDASSIQHLARVTFAADHAATLEMWIDKMDEELPALKNFILPVSV